MGIVVDKKSLFTDGFIVEIVLCVKGIMIPTYVWYLTRISHKSVRLRNKAFQPEDVVFYFEVLNNAVPVSLRLAFGEEF